ncbi:transglycosylase SLT domain-containing protein [Sulfurovum sp.]|uniref:transglycosylase SLT domain-containing protein n=1 Tax=Sulfurovum sp. TaxID=1969726 RepID=UPI0026041DFD|nr:transglycosylase SLT domain-containing protein [Sulfurovum sp.]
MYNTEHDHNNTFLSKLSAIRFAHRLYVIIAVFLLTTAASQANAHLAKTAGMSPSTLKKIVKKVVKIESTTGSYHARNRKSGAYGRYQIMPKTARAYAKKLHIPYSKWKRPRNQDRIFEAIMADNIRSLKRNGLKVNAFSIYGTHQQGAGGFNAIMKKKKLSKNLERNLRHNLPKRLSRVPRSRLKLAWVNYWKRKFA